MSCNALFYHTMQTLGRMVHMSNMQHGAVKPSVQHWSCTADVKHADCLMVRLVQQLVLSSPADDHSYNGGKFLSTQKQTV